MIILDIHAPRVGSKKEIAPNYYGITYQKRITRKRLLRDFGKGQNVPTLSESSTYVLLREDDIITEISVEIATKINN